MEVVRCGGVEVWRCGGRWTQQGDKYLYSTAHSTIIRHKNTVITIDIHYNSRLSNNYSTLHNNRNRTPNICNLKRNHNKHNIITILSNCPRYIEYLTLPCDIIHISYLPFTEEQYTIWSIVCKASLHPVI